MHSTAGSSSSTPLSAAAAAATASATSDASLRGAALTRSPSPDTSQSASESASTAGLNSLAEADSFLPNSPHKKRRYKVQLIHRPEQYRCQVCGDKALGFNFDAITCESCKAFFRRNAFKNNELKCNFSGCCAISINTRKFCSPCRLEKCFLVGMKKEWILNDSQLQQRRQKTLRKRSRRYGAETTAVASEATATSSRQALDQQQLECPCKSEEALQSHTDNATTTLNEYFVSPSSSSSGSATAGLTSDSSAATHGLERPVVQELTVLNFLDECSDDCESDDRHQRWHMCRPLSDTCADLLNAIRDNIDKKVNYLDVKDSRDICSAASTSVTSLEMPFAITTSFVQRFVNFVKSLPEYNLIDQVDMIGLIKGGVFHFILMRGAAIYSPRQDSFTFQSQAMGSRPHSLSLSALTQAMSAYPSGQQLVQRYRQFMIGYHEASSGDHLALTLLQLIEFYNPSRPLLRNMHRVDRIQQGYILLLKRYIESVRPMHHSRRIFFDLMNRLSELDGIASEFSELCHYVGFRCEELHPLLREIFELSECANATARPPFEQPAPPPQQPRYDLQLYAAAANFFQQQQQQHQCSFLFKCEPTIPR